MCWLHLFCYGFSSLASGKQQPFLSSPPVSPPCTHPPLRLAVIVKASSGPRYVVGCRNRVDKSKLVTNTRVTLDMTTLTIMRALPREVCTLADAAAAAAAAAVALP